MESLNDVNIYSVWFATPALESYLVRGGDANLELRSFWYAYTLVAYLINKSVFLYPLALVMALALLHPVPLFVVYPIVYFSIPAQPLLYYAIASHNIKAVRLLVEHKADLRKQNFSPRGIYYTPLEFARSTCCCYSEELIDLITPKDEKL